MIEIKHIAMYLAERIALKSNCSKRQVGFVLFDDKRIIKVGCNLHPVGKPCKCEPGVHDQDVLHAERLVLNGEMYFKAKAAVTYAPCIPCADELEKAALDDLYYKQVKHNAGIDHLAQCNIVRSHNEWLTDQQRIQAAWHLKWNMPGMELWHGI